eukprot:TRINITY_DN7853_c2_g2_i1.p1 TRINITY_DN7853_c2_g2~~TRINITY_DN7853_c2_g2_i1.p1  ORF type:complete len:222 (-),score=34.41 TRINITY_DN7853_c2_g2_i1:96-761(-)
MTPEEEAEAEAEAAAAAAAAERERAVKLPQSEAILEAIIRSSKPLPIGGEDERVLGSAEWFSRQGTLLSDQLVPWFRTRWFSFITFMGCFIARIVLIERHFFCAYVVAIYILNQLLLFISPATEDDDLPAGPRSSEYRPFVRALSEFGLWWRGFLTTIVGLVVTFFDDFDVEVDGRALFFYFWLLFAWTMKQQVFHMIKYRYVPWNPPKRRKLEKEQCYDV